MRTSVGLLLVAASCLGCAGGEPQNGKATAKFKGASFGTASGVAIAGQAPVNEGGMFVMIGDGDIDCDNAADSPPDGHYAVASLKTQMPGTDPASSVAVTFVSPAHLESIGPGGTVTIDSVDGSRVKGSMTMDDGAGTSISGTFDVKRCF